MNERANYWFALFQRGNTYCALFEEQIAHSHSFVKSYESKLLSFIFKKEQRATGAIWSTWEKGEVKGEEDGEREKGEGRRKRNKEETLPSNSFKWAQNNFIHMLTYFGTTCLMIKAINLINFLGIRKEKQWKTVKNMVNTLSQLLFLKEWRQQFANGRSFLKSN